MGQLIFEFDYFDLPANLFIYIIVPSIIYAILFIIANVLLILSGKNQKEEVINPNYLILVGEINIIFAIIRFFVPSLSFSGTLDIFQIIIYIIYIIFISDIERTITMATFGILIIIFGKRNENVFGNKIKRSGQVRFIGQSLLMLSTSISFISFFLGLNPQITSLITVIPSVLSVALILAAIIFLMIHGYNKKDKYFLYAGILLIVIHFLPIFQGFLDPILI